jgi:hypothetical protein
MNLIPLALALVPTTSPQEATPFVIRANQDWIPLRFELDVVPGSALDWSPRRTEPAGRKGWVKTDRNGKFVFEKAPNQPLRFYGVNLCFDANFPEKRLADRLADRLVRMGYNTVRFHHFDGGLTGGFEAKGPTSTQLDPAVLDRFDYLAAALKKRGITMTLDFFTIRQVRENEVVPGKIGMDEYKIALLTSEKARQNWWEFTRNLLEHKNPYTGIKWKEDPAVPWICVVNENNFGSAGRTPMGKKLLTEAYNAAGHKGEWSYESNEGARFAGELHKQAFRWMRDKMRSIGARALLTDNNGWYDQTALQENRAQLDFVDNHNYWDHPRFLGADWGLPSSGWSEGKMATQQLGGGLPSMSLTRLKGKPFTVSEFNFCVPNRYRAEGGLFMGALAARQDWDALWRFAWSHDDEPLKAATAMDYFNIQQDPIMLGTERALVALYLRRHLEPAPAEATVLLDDTKRDARTFNDPVMNEVFDTRVATTLNPAEAVRRMASGDKPVRVDRQAGTFAVNASQTAGAYAEAGTVVNTAALTVQPLGHRAAVWATSLDGKPLVSSRRILITHLTDAVNTEMTYRAPDREVLTAWGKLPHLIRNGQARVTFQGGTKNLKAYRLDMAGRRVEQLPVREGRIELNVNGPQGATLYYEVVRP